MKKDGDANRRRNQILAERSAQKAFREFNPTSLTELELYRVIELALTKSLHTQQWMGHVDRACELARAQRASRELRLRGVQQQIPGLERGTEVAPPQGDDRR